MARKKHFYQIENLGQTCVPCIVKIKPYIYCTSKDITNPDSEIQVKVDVWQCVGTGSTGFNPKVITTTLTQRCLVDLDEKTLTAKDGTQIDAPNIDGVISAIGKALEKWLDKKRG